MGTDRWITGLSEISDRYDGFIFDIWGTIYDGGTVFPGALDCLSAIHGTGKKIAILSNAPQLSPVVAKRLENLGIPEDLRDIIMTSGVETREFLETRPDAFYQNLGPKVFETAPNRCPDLIPDDWFERVPDLKDADFILNASVDRQEETVSDYQQLLDEGVSRNLPMVCANPDLEVVSNGERLVCAGLLAEYYETIGGTVRYHGKPHAGVFESTLRQLGTDKTRTIMIGDNLATDISGANRLGMDCLFLTNGIHAPDFSDSKPDALNDLEKSFNASPTWVAKSLIWQD